MWIKYAASGAEINTNIREELLMNKVIITGNLTKDSELRFTAGSGVAITKFTLAVQKRKKEDGADFINCVWFGKGTISSKRC